MCVSCIVMNNPELPLDPNLQTSNLLITFLKYASIVMQDTKGKQNAVVTPYIRNKQMSCVLLCSSHSYHYLFQSYYLRGFCVFTDEHRLNSARLCLIILTCIAEVHATLQCCKFCVRPHQLSDCSVLFCATGPVC